MYDIIIIGAGPAGLTAAIYALRANKKVLILEANKPGGNILKAHKVDNYPGLPHVTGEELAKSFLDQAIELGAELKYEKAMNFMNNDKTKYVQTIDNMYETRRERENESRRLAQLRDSLLPRLMSGELTVDEK